ncbi:MAG: hypothetical protein AEth_00102 [Candidatus Argoarchaeum ethanivorans]|uniref:Uncharacterized protein n=1 Tax=Candidatus Argoarchaeum ethanivorans TaxID=2608793 RepID=A0A8B3S7P9_9EURY|nr:MAG: hypothetical protein AEth_00102 [Candidatus Argoarchaeum ethanivorans]
MKRPKEPPYIALSSGIRTVEAIGDIEKLIKKLKEVK